MKKWIVMFLVMMIIPVSGYAQVRQNASPVTVGVNSNSTYSNITFPFEARDVIVENNDSTAYIYVDPTSNTNTEYKNDCYLLGPDEELYLGDFRTIGISILYDSVYSSDTEASPISVIGAY